ncbi:MAG: MBL fold metallo-hydrolase [Candidatus Korobacteraceae bacterium]|jgi:L-ascorbate metabolism protein UlaG (beta-lactamase superfamily)
MLSVNISTKAGQLSRLVKHSAMSRRTGRTYRPVLAASGQMGVTFIGHSSFFLQIGGANVVIDPIFAPWLFLLKRLRRPGLRIKDLPPLDAVLVTHAHFDHLHRPSLRALARATRIRSGRTPLLIVPDNVTDLVFDLGFDRVVELGWWQQFQLGGVLVTATPAKHWGARVIRDVHRGYGGYCLSGGSHSIYHSGDTAYFSGFREIGQRLNPDVALLPIGAYQPESFRNVHTSPEDALHAFADLGARHMIPMHFGTFKLSQEPVDEPVKRLLSGALRLGITERVHVLEEGVAQFF